jgi:hypothetical protein
MKLMFTNSDLSNIKIIHFRPSTLAIYLAMSSVIHDIIMTNNLKIVNKELTKT